jgi:ABC-type dipeptide/oligopeptide/nickel transport system permease subunit
MAVERVEEAARIASGSPSREAWLRLRRNPVAMISAGIIVLMAVLAIIAPLIARYPYDYLDRGYELSAPGSKHWLGTDHLGQDVWSRLLYGARASLTVGLVVSSLGLCIGVTMGILAGYRGGIWDTILGRITDAMFAFPDLLFAILLVGILRPTSPIGSFLTVFVALALVGWPGMARLVRGQALQLRNKEFVEAARAAGVRDWRIITRHLLPNMLSPIIVAVTVDIAGVILADATLSFLGIGIQPPYPSWGRMIRDSLPHLRSEPLLILFPSLLLGVTVLAFNFFGDALRDALDPRLRE